MKRMSLITNVLAALMIVLAALGSLCSSVTQKAFDVQLYSGMSRQAVMDTLGVTDAMDVSAQTTAYIGLTDEEQSVFAQEMVSFMKGETDAQPAVLNEREQQHMLDVRSLVLLAQQASQVLMTIAAGLAVVIAWTGARSSRSAVPLGTLAGVVIIAAFAGLTAIMINMQSFEALFIRFHELLFANDLWLLNPQTDILIRMMPQLLFERAAMDVAVKALQTFMIVWIMQCAVYLIVGGMIRRNLTERETP